MGIFYVAVNTSGAIMPLASIFIAMVVNLIIGAFNDFLGAYYSFYIISFSVGVSIVFVIFIKSSCVGVNSRC